MCVSVCLSVTTLAATSFTFKQKIRYYRLHYGVFNSRISPTRLRSGDMAILACLYDCDCLLLTENTPAVLDTTRTDIIREALATATKTEQLSSTLESKLLTWHCAGTLLADYVIACNAHSCGLQVTLGLGAMQYYA